MGELRHARPGGSASSASGAPGEAGLSEAGSSNARAEERGEEVARLRAAEAEVEQLRDELAHAAAGSMTRDYPRLPEMTRD